MRAPDRAEAGSTAVEFAVLLPLILLFILGSIEMAIVLFIGSSIQAAVMEASRYGVTKPEEGESRADKVLQIVAAKTYGLLDMDQVRLETLIYDDFDSIDQPEPWDDDNGNGAWDAGEDYSDINGNGHWDADMGEAGLGEGGDVVVYRLSYDWGLVTPMLRRALGESITHVSSIAVRNEPFN